MLHPKSPLRKFPLLNNDIDAFTPILTIANTIIVIWILSFRTALSIPSPRRFGPFCLWWSGRCIFSQFGWYPATTADGIRP
jgi:hypothetical protein